MDGALQLGLKPFLDWLKVLLTQLSGEVSNGRYAGIKAIFGLLILSFYITNIYWFMSKWGDGMLTNQLKVLTIIWATLKYKQAQQWTNGHSE